MFMERGELVLQRLPERRTLFATLLVGGEVGKFRDHIDVAKVAEDRDHDEVANGEAVAFAPWTRA